MFQVLKDQASEEYKVETWITGIMGQIVAFFGHLWQICKCSADQQESEDPDDREIDMGLELTDRQVEDLSQIIAARHMASIAIKYLDFPQETVENLRSIRQDDYMGFNRNILTQWRNRNPMINQVQVSSDPVCSKRNGKNVSPEN